MGLALRTVLCILVLLLAMPSAALGAEEISRPRNVYILCDISYSYRRVLDMAKRQIAATIENSGPNDRIVLIHIGPGFDPLKSIRAQCEMPRIPAGFVWYSQKLNEWEQKQRLVDGVWRDTRRMQASLSGSLRANTQSLPGGTDLYGALEYCSLRIEQAPAADHYVLLYTDLRHDFNRVSSDRPPKTKLAFRGAVVEALFVPWGSATLWRSKEEVWRRWFIDHGAAKTFSMVDEASSINRISVAPSPVPKRVKSPIERGKR